jgi:predicted RNA-binding Zn-ribbon protein involved in translation (DUF1610 family)
MRDIGRKIQRYRLSRYGGRAFRCAGCGWRGAVAAGPAS